MVKVQGWTLQKIDTHKLTKRFAFFDEKTASDLINGICSIAEEEKHHPKIVLSDKYIEIRICTKNVQGLSENDFILAAKIDDYELNPGKYDRKR